jgi:hypothetical protein
MGGRRAECLCCSFTVRLDVSAQLPGGYRREAITIQVAGNGLSVGIRGVVFTGAGFDVLEPSAGLGVAAAFATDHGTLTDCELDWHTPVQVARAGRS